MSDLERLAMHLSIGQRKLDELESLVGSPDPKNACASAAPAGVRY